MFKCPAIRNDFQDLERPWNRFPIIRIVHLVPLIPPSSYSVDGRRLIRTRPETRSDLRKPPHFTTRRATLREQNWNAYRQGYSVAIGSTSGTTPAFSCELEAECKEPIFWNSSSSIPHLFVHFFERHLGLLRWVPQSILSTNVLFVCRVPFILQQPCMMTTTTTMMMLMRKMAREKVAGNEVKTVTQIRILILNNISWNTVTRNRGD